MAVARMQQRRDTTTRWTSVNPVLLDGELGYDTTLDRYKVGDGVLAWLALPWSDRLEQVQEALGDAQDAADAAAASAATAADIAGDVAGAVGYFDGTELENFALAMMPGQTGLAVDQGRVRAAVAGTLGSWTLMLPGGVLDHTRPFRFHAVVQVTDPTDTNRATIALTSAVRQGRGVDMNIIGGVAGPGGTALAAIAAGGGSPIGARPQGSSLNATSYEVAVIGDGERVTVSTRPVGLRAGGFDSLNPGTGGGGPGSMNEDAVTMTIATTNGYDGQKTWVGIDRIIIETASTTAYVVSAWLNQDGYEAPLLDTTSHAAHRPLVPSGSGSTLITNTLPTVLVKGYDGRGVRPLVMVNHQNQTGPDAGLNNVANVLAEALRDAGFTVMSVFGKESGDLADPVNSSWGSARGRAPRYAALDYVRSVMLPRLGAVHLLGFSMGLADSLNLHRAYPGLFRSIHGFGGVSNLGACYDGEGGAAANKGAIDNAYGTTTRAAIEQFSPSNHVDQLTDVAIRLYNGTADTIVGPGPNGTAFAAAVNSAGGDATSTLITGGDHLSELFWTPMAAYVPDIVQTIQAASI